MYIYDSDIGHLVFIIKKLVCSAYYKLLETDKANHNSFIHLQYVSVNL